MPRRLPQSEILTGSHWGAFRAKVEDGRFVGIRPWEKDPHPAPVLEGIMDSVYSPTRIKYPMVRRAFLEHGFGADPEGRGDGDFVRVTWDQALDLVAKELKRVDQTHGPAASFAGSYGWKSPGKLHNCQNLLRRMMSLKGGFVNSSGDYSTGASQVVLALRGRIAGGLRPDDGVARGRAEHRADGVLGRRPHQQ